VDEAAESIVAFDVYRSTPGEWDRVDRAIGRSLAKAPGAARRSCSG
jgi:hypothetical protein